MPDDYDGRRAVPAHQTVAFLKATFPRADFSEARVLTASWDSVAVDTGREIFKFPQREAAAQALRREASILSVLRPLVSLAVPDIVLFETPILFSRHTKIQGQALEPAAYAGLAEREKDALAETLALFCAELHGLSVELIQGAGALPVGDWLTPEAALRGSWPRLDVADRPHAEGLVGRWLALGSDPCGQVYGHFDGHGWNMAFDPQTRRLNGVFDFADSGIGPLHRDFVYSSLVAVDLTRRLVRRYERVGRSVDAERVETLIGAHRLWELATAAESDVTARRNGFRGWVAAHRLLL